MNPPRNGMPRGRATPTQNEHTEKPEETSAAAVMLAAFRKSNPEAAERVIAYAPAGFRFVVSRCCGHLVELCQMLGEAATAARAGDVDKCADVLRRMQMTGEEANRLILAALEELGLTESDLRGFFFNAPEPLGMVAAPAAKA